MSGSEDKTLKYWDVFRFANGSGDRQNPRGASERGTLDLKQDVDTREDDSACTTDSVGHKVRVELADRGCI